MTGNPNVGNGSEVDLSPVQNSRFKHRLKTGGLESSRTTNGRHPQAASGSRDLKIAHVIDTLMPFGLLTILT